MIGGCSSLEANEACSNIPNGQTLGASNGLGKYFSLFLEIDFYDPSQERCSATSSARATCEPWLSRALGNDHIPTVKWELFGVVARPKGTPWDKAR